MKPFRRVIAVLLLAFLLPGCTVTVLERSPLPAGEPPRDASLTVSVYENRDAEEMGALLGTSARTRLYRTGAGGAELLRESTEPRWTFGPLAPGSYRIALVSWVDAAGRLHDSSADDDFELAAGDEARVSIVLRDYRALFWTTLSAAAVVLMVSFAGAIGP